MCVCVCVCVCVQCSVGTLSSVAWLSLFVCCLIVCFCLAEYMGKNKESGACQELALKQLLKLRDITGNHVALAYNNLYFCDAA